MLQKLFDSVFTTFCGEFKINKIQYSIVLKFKLNSFCTNEHIMSHFLSEQKLLLSPTAE